MSLMRVDHPAPHMVEVNEQEVKRGKYKPTLKTVKEDKPEAEGKPSGRK